MNKCRVCGYDLFAEPLLRYENMPRYAQSLPSENELSSDKGIDLDIYQCAGCGLVQLNIEPVPYYKEVIRAAAISDEMTAFRKKQFDAFVQKYKLKGKKIIEIGCGRGEYLSIMKTTGADAYGLEASAGSVSYCVENGLKVSKGFIDKAKAIIPNAPFDAFYILSFFEHLPEPNAALGGIRNNLSDDAIGLIEVPNFDMILRKNLFAEFISDHLLYFTKETLATALRLNGFEILEMGEVWHEYIISAVVKVDPSASKLQNASLIGQSKRLDISHFYQNQNKLKLEIEMILSRYNNKSVAIWGAGHQALSVISMTGIGQRIKYIIDSAPFKQGKFTPATHIPIVSPDALNTDPVDAIIVMAASYSDEVAKNITNMYGNKISTFILRENGLENG